MIVGAGFAGLIAAHVFPRENIIEAAPEPQQAHRALLRFRSEVVGKLTGIPFKKVRVRKGLYYKGFQQPTISFANAYSQKCLGEVVGERSIWNLDPVDRFIAPESFYEQLIDAVGKRITWEAKADYEGAIAFGNREPIISTAPLPTVLEAIGELPEGLEFKRAPITVLRYRLKNCDVHQTVYFPTHEHSLYRASITGDLLLCEFAGEVAGEEWLLDVAHAFGIRNINESEPLDSVKQSYGKILPITEGVRRKLIHELSLRHKIFSIGRFSTWRNILLDDVVNDAAVIKQLIQGDHYDLRKKAI